MSNMSIQPLWLTYFIEILLVLEFQLTKTYFGTFSYKAHFRPQISSNWCDFIDKEPSNHEEVTERKEWKDAMNEYYQSIMNNDFWDIVPKPKRKSIVASNWIYKIKHAIDCSIEKYKARFVAHGFS